MPALPVSALPLRVRSLSARVARRLRSPQARRWLHLALRFLLGSVFAAAAIPKLLDPAAFALDIDNYRLLPAALVGPLSVALPVLELVVAIALVFGVHTSGAALLTMGMLLAFALGMAQAMARGIDLSCGCFGSATTTEVSGLTVLRNVLLALCCVPLVLEGRAPSASDEEHPSSGREPARA